MWKTGLVSLALLALALATAVGIECAKGNVELFGRQSGLPDVMVRVEGRNCPLYYSRKLQ